MAISLYVGRRADMNPGNTGPCGSSGSRVNIVCVETPCCPFAINTFGSNTTDTAYVAMSKEVYDLCLSSSKTINLTWDAFSVCHNEFQVCIDGVFVYSTACVVGTGSHNVTIPAGTAKVTIFVSGNCTNILGCGDQWSLVVTCL